MEPFPCPECGHLLLVDAIREQPEQNGTQIYTVERVLDDTTSTDPELQRFERNAELRSMGRWDLYRRASRLEALNRELKEELSRRGWWTRFRAKW